MGRAGIARSFAVGMYRSLGASLVELLWLAARPALPASRLTDLDDASRAILDRIHARGRGMVLATAHAGNWEVAAAAIAERYPLTAVAKPMRVGWVNRFCRRIRTARRIAVASPRGAMATARAALGRGEVVAMLIDQVPDRARHALAVEFLGATAHVNRAPAALAAAARTTLVLGVARREGARQVLEVIAVLEPPARPRSSWVDEATRAATLALDRFVRAHPSEWLWLHRRWRPAPP